MSQMSFGDAEFAGKHKKTRREHFLEEMEQVVPWKRIVSLIAPFYPVEGNGRPPMDLEKMLRVHLLQNWFGLSDPGAEEALMENIAMRRFSRFSMREKVPDESTILKFRHLLERHDLSRDIFQMINADLARKGLLLKEGSIVDATIISAPSSTKNKEGKRDPEMHSAKKGNQWFFGMKAHIGADAESGLVHTLVATPAHESDVNVVDELLHGKESFVHGDSGYAGASEHVKNKKLRWEIARRPSSIAKLKSARARRAIEREETRKASVRAKVEHPFRRIKCQFGLKKVRFKGLAKNTAQLFMLFALSNLATVRKKLMAMAAPLRPQTA